MIIITIGINFINELKRSLLIVRCYFFSGYLTPRSTAEVITGRLTGPVTHR